MIIRKEKTQFNWKLNRPINISKESNGKAQLRERWTCAFSKHLEKVYR